MEVALHHRRERPALYLCLHCHRAYDMMISSIDKGIITIPIAIYGFLLFPDTPANTRAPYFTAEVRLVVPSNIPTGIGSQLTFIFAHPRSPLTKGKRARSEASTQRTLHLPPVVEPDKAGSRQMAFLLAPSLVRGQRRIGELRDQWLYGTL